jgi:hypothetical protein
MEMAKGIVCRMLMERNSETHRISGLARASTRYDLEYIYRGAHLFHLDLLECGGYNFFMSHLYLRLQDRPMLWLEAIDTQISRLQVELK